jgi:hypothetical protein
MVVHGSKGLVVILMYILHIYNFLNWVQASGCPENLNGFKTYSTDSKKRERGSPPPTVSSKNTFACYIPTPRTRIYAPSLQQLPAYTDIGSS